MKIHIGFDITIDRQGPATLVLALLPRPEEAHRIVESGDVRLSPHSFAAGYKDEFGNRRVRVAPGTGLLRLQWDGMVTDSGLHDQVPQDATFVPVMALPADVLPFLLPSRYCQSDLMVTDAWQRFGHIPEGWQRVQAVSDFVHSHITFGYHHAHMTKSALDVLHDGRGVCRDFAHLTIALCRALNMPARYVSGYIGDIGVPYAGPGDFCAWVEVYLGGAWRTVDARYNTPRIGRIKMVHGRDAIDVPMISSFGTILMNSFTVWCDEVTEASQPQEQSMRFAS